jgi:hypothetical protein
MRSRQVLGKSSVVECALRELTSGKIWWAGTGLNRRRQDFSDLGGVGTIGRYRLTLRGIPGSYPTPVTKLRRSRPMPSDGSDTTLTQRLTR